MSILAAVVLLPAWRRLDDARARRDELAAETWVYDQLIQHKRGMIESIKEDPLLTERILIDQQNYRRLGEMSLTVEEAPTDPSVAAVLAAHAPAGAAGNPTLRRLSHHMERPRTRHGLLLIAGILMIAAFALPHHEAREQESPE